MGVDHVFVVHRPKGPQAAPVVLDSPHSGHIYPDDFRHSCPRDWLRETEDSHVDKLFGDAPALGLPLLCALFPRCYIDVNRAPDDIDPLLLDAPWPGEIRPSERSRMGMGLIRRLFKTTRPEPIYDRFLPPSEIQARLDGYYHPYHKALENLLNETHQRFGAVWHLNCHSMPELAPSLTRHRPDIVLGDRDGTTCDAAFTRFVAQALRNMGYKVAINRPYKGVEIVRRYADPARNRHCLQIELRRSMYMDERTRRPTAGFAATRQTMALLMQKVIEFTRENMIDLAAD